MFCRWNNGSRRGCTAIRINNWSEFVLWWYSRQFQHRCMFIILLVSIHYRRIFCIRLMNFEFYDSILVTEDQYKSPWIITTLSRFLRNQWSEDESIVVHLEDILTEIWNSCSRDFIHHLLILQLPQSFNWIILEELKMIPVVLRQSWIKFNLLNS